MKLQFKIQPYQTAAVESVIDCFAGQAINPSASYRLDPGNREELTPMNEGFKNAAIQLADLKVLANIKEVQKRQNLPISSRVAIRLARDSITYLYNLLVPTQGQGLLSDDQVGQIPPGK